MDQIAIQIFPKDSNKIRGTAAIGSTCLSIHGEGISEKWEFDRISAKIGGAADKLCFLSYNRATQIESIYFPRTKENLLKIQQIKSPFVDELASNASRLRQHFWLGMIGAMAALGLIIMGAVSLAPKALDLAVETVPYSLEKELGDNIIGLALPPTKVLKLPEIEETLRMQMQPILEQLPEEQRDIKIYISSDGDLNAFAVPGGHIVFNRGLLEKAQSIEEVLGVAAHEIAHVTQRHSLKSLTQTLGIYLTVDLILGDISGIIAILADNSQLLFQRAFSREHESEADEVGYRYLVNAQISPEGLISFFQLISKEMEKNSDQGLHEYLSFLSTHPGTEERIKALSEKIKKDKISFEPIKFDYDQFK